MKHCLAFLIAAFSCIYLAACQKKDGTTPEPSKVVTTFTSPSEGQVFHTGDTIHIHATVSYPAELHGYELIIEDTVNGEELFSLDEHVHADNFTIDTTWVPALSAATTLRLQLTTEIDHDGNEASSGMNIFFEP